MKSLLKLAGILACVVALGLNLQYAMDGWGIKSGKLINEVLAQNNTGTGTGSGSGTGTGTSCPACPDYNYTSNAKITSATAGYNVTSNINGEVSVGTAVKAGFAKNKTVAVIVETKNCVIVTSCSCCDQRNVGSTIL